MSLVEVKVTKKRFVDVDMSFNRHPVSSDIGKKVNESAIIASIKNLVLTRIYGRPFHPELSSQVYDLLFEPLTPGTGDILKRTIKYVIENFEPRAEVLLIEVSDTPDESAIQVVLVIRMVGTVENIKTQFLLKRSL
jgi:phage baseplate assembly protein W